MNNRGTEGTEELEYITDRAIYSYAKRIERQRLKDSGSSLTASSLAMRASPFIIECRGLGIVVVRKGWRDAIKAAT